MRLGLGLGVCDARANSPVLWDIDFSALSVGAYTGLPSAFTFARASVASVADYAASVVYTTGINVDVPRIGKTAAGRVGLRLEESRTNRVRNNRTIGTGGGAPNWFVAAGTYTDGKTGPDNVASADRVQLGSGTNSSQYWSENIGTVSMVASQWMRADTGTAAVFAWLEPSGAAVQKFTGTLSTTWQRIAVTGTATAASGSVWVPLESRTVHGESAAARDCWIDLVQVEIGKWATEAIYSGGSATTRSGELLRRTLASDAISSGRIGLEFRFEPPVAHTGFSANMRLWTIDANNYAEINFTTRVVTVVIGGASYSTASAVSWAAGDLVELWLEAGGGSLNTTVKYRVNGGSVTTLGTSGAPQAAISPGSNPLDLLCNGTAGQLSCLLQSIKSYKNNVRPAWAV